MKSLDEARADRFRFLNQLYELTGGNELKFYDMYKIGESLGLERDEVTRIAQFLEGERLVQVATDQGGTRMLHSGVVQVEAALSQPDKPTEYFPAVNIIQVGTMVNSQIQQATHGSAQTLAITEDERRSIEQLLDKIRSSIGSLDLSGDIAHDLDGQVATIDAQLTTSAPKKAILKQCLSSVFHILEKIGASALAATVKSFLQRADW